MIQVVTSLVVWAILQVISINVIGNIVRRLLCPIVEVEAPTERLHDVFDNVNRRVIRAHIWSVIVAGAYLWALYHYWNLGLVVAACIAMIGRIPDLLFELRTGQKVTRTVGPKGVAYYSLWAVNLLSAVLVWYSLYRWER